MQTTKIETEITGFLVGNIWWPVGAECWKDVRYRCQDEQARTEGKMTLRDHILRITNDGDFQSCVIAQGEITITATRYDPERRTLCRRSRSWPLDRFPSVADCLHDDPDWWPSCPDEE
jgi:hypothetical protein